MVWLVLGGVLALFLLTVFFGAPYVPSRKQDINVAFGQLYQIKSSDLLVDVGSGDGVVLRAAADRGARAIGYEINPILVAISWLISRRHSRVQTKWRNFLKSNLPEGTTVVYLFAESYHIAGISRWLDRQAGLSKHPLYVLSYGFSLPGRQPIREIGAHRLYRLEALQRLKPQV